MNKYKAKKVMLDGIVFDSGREAKRYSELKLLERAGVIRNLALQVPFMLAPACKFAGESRATPAVRYFADFCYFDIAKAMPVVEDVKSPVTAKLSTFRLKRHLMKTVCGVELVVVA